MRAFIRTAGLASAIATLALTTLPTTASAGTYTQYTCKLPDGSVAATDGWGSSAASAGFRSGNDCAIGGPLWLQMQGVGLVQGAQRVWRWTPPAGLALGGVTLSRAFSLAPGDVNATPAMQLLAGQQSVESHGSATPYGDGVAQLGSFADPTSPSNRASSGTMPLAASGFSAAVNCTGASGSSCPNSGVMSELRIHSAAFTLSDPSAPVVSNVRGGLMAGGAKQGVQSLSFDATDAGGGLYRVLVDVDGQLPVAAVADPSNERCADVVPSNSDPYEFQYAVPCPLQLTGVQASLDTRTLGDGDHLVRVRVEDAAGNRSTVYGPATVSVANGPAPAPAPADGGGTTTTTTPANPYIAPVAPAPVPAGAPAGQPNGQGGGAGARLSTYAHGTVRIRYGRAATIRGRLIGPNGDPVRGAVIDVYAQTRVRGAALVKVGVVTTAGDGSFSYVAPVGASRLVRLAYRAHVQDTDFAQTTDVDLSVVPRVTLSVNHSRLRNGQTLRYRGRIAGPNTKGGLAEIRVRGRGRWITVCVARVGSGGRFGCAYRFRATYRPTRYVFRAVVRRQGGLPYEPGQSGARSVYVRP